MTLDNLTTHQGLRLSGIHICLGDRVLVALNARVLRGQTLTVMGPSGSGKSTLLAYLGGFLDPAFEATGRVFVDGVDLIALKAEKRRAGILFQDPLLFPHLSVADNIAIAIPETVRGRRQRRALADAALEEAGLAEYGDRDPDTLSGGQKARVALQRVLMSQPRLLLLDEPFSKLDAGLREQTRQLVFDQARRAGLPVVLVTHDEEDAHAAGGQVHEVGPA
ncbi:ATP-binding cassette domain-containing protein [Hoeflea sp. YIM 152468]|uniref:ATP-binding cassette domain-containing protein n=1 Tax=Hoeflea sp. YIM 152468 TaxID=3031759 RepID=UPI0023DB0166|nr:ATP-binding cassette domain-containing protein [Hoeflea sp. YIM 152468]MDF1610438.1 ATP-binding cassette domain-containing protein [Hoeflea sp. YIM 152468]